MKEKPIKFHLEAAIPKIQKYFSRQKDIVAAYLFGSYAKNRQTKRSDLDIGIIFTKSPDSYDRQFKIASDLEKILNGPPVDVRELSFDSSPVFLVSVLKNAKLIIENNRHRRINFEVKTMQEFIDDQKYRQIQYDYLKRRLQERIYAN